MTTYTSTLARDKHFTVTVERADGESTAILNIASVPSAETGHLSYTTVILFSRLVEAVQHLSDADRRPA